MAIFKAYDIRGTVPDQLNPEIARSIGAAFATFIQKESGKECPAIVVARDMRTHGPAITRAFMKGVCDAGANVLDAGLATTPMLYAAVGLNPSADAGAMVTASHNGPSYNGFKLCRAQAVPISGDTGLKEIEALCENPNEADERGKILPWHSAKGDSIAPAALSGEVNADLWKHYCLFAKSFKEEWPSGLRVAVDPANGAGCLYVPLLKAMGLAVTAINDRLDGNFPNHEANPIKAHNLAPTQDLVLKTKAALGIAFDGDADRVVFVDEKGQAVPADLATALLARRFLKKEPKAAVLYDLRSSRAVAKTIADAGGRGVRERVGHSFMKGTMKREKCIFGGELSGHYYFRDTFNADSSLRAAIAMLNLLAASDKPLSALVAGVKLYAQSGEINFIVKDKEAIMGLVAESFVGAQVDHLDGVTVAYDDWWLNLRPSNTEPLLRLNIEAENAAMLEEKLAHLRTLIGGQEESH